VLVFFLIAAATLAEVIAAEAGPVYQVSPIGWVRKAEGKTLIESDEIDAFADTPVRDIKP
jgi:hypothetical protein